MPRLMLAPALYNPSAFSLERVRRDHAEWTAWLSSAAFEDVLFGQKAGAVSSGDLNHNNWYSWLNVEPPLLKLLHALFRLAIYGSIGIQIAKRIAYLPDIASGDRQLRDVWL